MTALDKLMAQARLNPATIALPESSDPRILNAAVSAAREGVSKPVLLLNQREADALATEHGLDLGAIELIDPSDPDNLQRWAEALHQLRAHKGMTVEKARNALASPLTAATLMCQLGEVDGVVAGAVSATADVVRNALQIVGARPGAALVSSFMLMLAPEGASGGPEAMIFSDCGLVIDPDSTALTEIARAAGYSAQSLLGEAPKVAMLSFSTAGSARHAAVDKVRTATEGLRALEPDWQIVGEIQFDAAWVPELLAKKAPSANFDAPANVFVFPDLDAGNLGYKIAQRLGGWQVIGPLLQGLNRPINDLSRGCDADDVLVVQAVTSLQVAARPTLSD